MCSQKSDNPIVGNNKQSVNSNDPFANIPTNYGPEIFNVSNPYDFKDPQFEEWLAKEKIEEELRKRENKHKEPAATEKPKAEVLH